MLVLERPDIPLHNDLSERDIRAYVIKRKISGCTRSENGRRCRDTFTSLIKTCRKQDINFWDYLGDRQLVTQMERLQESSISLDSHWRGGELLDALQGVRRKI